MRPVRVGGVERQDGVDGDRRADLRENRVDSVDIERGALDEAVRGLPELVASMRAGRLLEAVVDRVRELTGALEVCVVQRGSDGRDARAVTNVSTGVADSRSSDLQKRASHEIVARVARCGRPVWHESARVEDRLANTSGMADPSLRSVGCVPLGSSQVVVLSDPRGGGGFPTSARVRVEALCRVAAPLVANDSVERSGECETMGDLVGSSPPMLALFERIRIFAPMPWPVLILGRSGTGKEGVARALHRLSGRSGPLVVVNCGTIPSALAESMLFGHARGAFTGATENRDGLVGTVGDGTLFLDEVGDLPDKAQVSLLRLIQEATWRPVGCTRFRTFGGRVIAATHRPIDDPLGRGTFREDLYHRLAAVVIRTPQLESRLEDLQALAEHLIAKEEVRLPQCSGGLSMSPGTVPALREALAATEWAGQVRGLQALLFQAIAHCVASGRCVIQPTDVPQPFVRPGTSGGESMPPVDDYKEALRTFKRTHLQRVLRQAGGNKSEAARRLGVSRQGLFRMLTGLDGWPSSVSSR